MTRGRGSTAAWWAFTLAWTAVVLLLSTEPFSARHTGGALRAVLEWLGLPTTVAEARTVNVRVRTTAHVAEYALLAGLWLRAWRPARADFARAALVVLAVCLACAVADEAHQLRVPARKGNAHDVGLDGAGALLGIVTRRLIARP